MRLTKGEIVRLSTLLIVFCAVLAAVVFVALLGQSLHSTWPDSAEFSTLDTGQERFSEHATNVDGLVVVVDHATGVQYLVTDTGACPLLNADGSPLMVLEVGDASQRL